jgi:hypothetical protein
MTYLRLIPVFSCFGINGLCSITLFAVMDMRGTA